MQIEKNSVSSVIIDVLACYDETGKSEMQDLCLFMYLGPKHQWCEDPIGIAPFIIFLKNYPFNVFIRTLLTCCMMLLY